MERGAPRTRSNTAACGDGCAERRHKIGGGLTKSASSRASSPSCRRSLAAAPRGHHRRVATTTDTFGMAIKTLAHVSDLHIGKSVETERRAIGIRDALVAAGVDHVVITGDLTHRGRMGELAVFWRIFACFREQERLT